MRVMSGVYWFGVALSSLAMFPIAVVLFVLTTPFDRRGVVLHGWTSIWASLYTWLNPWWHVEVTGRSLIPKQGPAVFVANHLSVVDILVLFRLFTHFKWVSKRSNFKIPVIGWNMWMNRYVPLVRGDRDSIAAMFARCEETLRRGSSVFMFPEGTRSEDGVMRPFKSGAFGLALRMGVPIVPIAIQGSERALPKKGFTIRRAAITVDVLEPVWVEGLEGATAESLTATVEDRIRTHIRARASS